MRFWILVAVIAAAYSAPQLPDQGLLLEIFGTPPPTTPSGLDNISIKPTEPTTTYKDKYGDECKCVPYYLCDKDRNGKYVNDPNITGFGLLDVRFNANSCQQVVEVCCTLPKEEPEIVTPTVPKKLKGCGHRNANGLDFKITGGVGNEAEFGEFPWVIALMDSEALIYTGVGVLIHPQVVVTGAHIASKFGPGKLLARAGEWDTATEKERLKYQERVIQEIYIHTEYHSKSLRNDMALLRLAEPFVLADHINVICMPGQDEFFDSSRNCVSNGWGKNVFGKQGVYAVILKKVEVDMVGFNQCDAALKRTRLGKHFKLDRSFVCAGGVPGKDTCKGDGGGPLACPIGDGRYKLTGLVAWGIGCGDEVPAVYVNVPKFRNWVDDKMKAWGYDTSGYNV